MPNALQRSQPVKLLDALAALTDTSSATYALPPANNSLGRILTWQSIPNVAPSAISLQLLGAFNDVTAEYTVLDSSTVVAGELKTITNVNVRFIRARQVSRTGGTSITVQAMIQ